MIKARTLLYSAAMLSMVAAPLAAPATQVVAHADDIPANGTRMGNAARSEAASRQNDSSSSDSQAATKAYTLSKSYVVYGAGVAQSQYSDLNDAFGSIDDSFQQLTATANDYNTYINKGQDSGTTNAAMISSVAIAPGDPGSGIKVNIKKYNSESNITQVTAQQYAMVAQMAGVKDVTITVTANRPVSGTSALTGVYVALAKDGANLDTANTSTANDMLGATQGAISQNDDDKSYPGKLMAAVGDTSKQVAQQKQDGQQVTQPQAESMLKDNLAKRGISDQTPASSITKIGQVLVNFQNAPISNSKSYINNVGNTIDNVKNSTGSMMNKAKQWLNSKDGQEAQQQAQSWWSRFVTWIQGIFNSN